MSRPETVPQVGLFGEDWREMCPGRADMWIGVASPLLYFARVWLDRLFGWAKLRLRGKLPRCHKVQSKIYKAVCGPPSCPFVHFLAPSQDPPGVDSAAREASSLPEDAKTRHAGRTPGREAESEAVPFGTESSTGAAPPILFTPDSDCRSRPTRSVRRLGREDLLLAVPRAKNTTFRRRHRRVRLRENAVAWN